jgi:glycyl-tRNA synthetase beta chain
LLLPDAGVLTALNKRIGNILKKASPDEGAKVEARLFSEPDGAEASLHRVAGTLGTTIGGALAERRYGETLTALIALSAPVAEFFERTMVMDENLERRANRLALLREVQRLLASVADLSRLPG